MSKVVVGERMDTKKGRREVKKRGVWAWGIDCIYNKEIKVLFAAAISTLQKEKPPHLGELSFKRSIQASL